MVVSAETRGPGVQASRGWQVNCSVRHPGDQGTRGPGRLIANYGVFPPPFPFLLYFHLCLITVGLISCFIVGFSADLGADLPCFPFPVPLACDVAMTTRDVDGGGAMVLYGVETVPRHIRFQHKSAKSSKKLSACFHDDGRVLLSSVFHED